MEERVDWFVGCRQVEKIQIFGKTMSELFAKKWLFLIRFITEAPFHRVHETRSENFVVLLLPLVVHRNVPLSSLHLPVLFSVLSFFATTYETNGQFEPQTSERCTSAQHYHFCFKITAVRSRKTVLFSTWSTLANSRWSTKASRRRKSGNR